MFISYFLGSKHHIIDIAKEKNHSLKIIEDLGKVDNTERSDMFAELVMIVTLAGALKENIASHFIFHPFSIYSTTMRKPRSDLIHRETYCGINICLACRKYTRSYERENHYI